MERQMTVFASEMAEYRLEPLYEIVHGKYKKFKIFYRLVEEFADEIKKLKYEESADDILDVIIKLSNEDTVDEFMSKLMEKINSKKIACNIVSEGKKIKISIQS